MKAKTKVPRPHLTQEFLIELHNLVGIPADKQNPKSVTSESTKINSRKAQICDLSRVKNRIVQGPTANEGKVPKLVVILKILNESCKYRILSECDPGGLRILELESLTNEKYRCVGKFQTKYNESIVWILMYLLAGKAFHEAHSFKARFDLLVYSVLAASGVIGELDSNTRSRFIEPMINHFQVSKREFKNASSGNESKCNIL